ncbi:MAG: glycosyltransferase family 39 protein [Chloroflexota bacterium]|nr:glycosyltransferase family 39 protein [Chloroflexota bacterium]
MTALPPPDAVRSTPAISRWPPSRRYVWLWLVIVLLVAGGLRLINLSYAELQGDEAIVMELTAQTLEGNTAVLFQHLKGPVEILVVMAQWRLTGITNEWMSRLPFSYAGILGIVAIYLLGKRVRCPRVGGVAALLLAIEGYFVAFGRIIQYQSIVFVVTTLGLLCLCVYYEEENPRLLITGTALFAGGGLTHYDAILALPAALFLIGASLWRKRDRSWRAIRPLLLAGLIGVLIIGSFYYPFLTGPFVEFTTAYIGKRVGSTQLSYNNLRSIFELSTVYDSIYWLGLMTVALVVQILRTWKRWGRGGIPTAILLLSTAASTALWPELILAWVPFALLLLGALLAPGPTIKMRTLWLWLGVPALFYLFFVERPLTHIHTAFPAWTLLGSLPIVLVGEKISTLRPRARYAAIGAATLLCTLCSYYPILMFVDHTPEYRRTFPENKNPLYWTPYTEIPPHGLFGFPYRAGWKVVGYLADQGTLVGNYQSNEELPITSYYFPETLRWRCPTPDMYLIAPHVQDEVYIRWDQVDNAYRPALVVTVEGKPKLTLYRHDVTAPPLTLAVEDYTWQFDQGMRAERLVKPLPEFIIAKKVPTDYEPVDAQIGDFALLRGYTLETAHAMPGGYVDLTLVWEVLQSTEGNYNVFTHLYDGVTLHGQLDGSPVCSHRPTVWWEAGETVVDPYRIPINVETPPGSVPLLIGMYEGGTSKRLPIRTESGETLENHLYLTDVVVQTP